ncbi:acyltransferase [Leucobacter sp. USHLN153]|uniref:acyltransferase n=1 Tax=Leucobacter sp. USHLN153 TaxID=3081268 RepID=UPI00301923FA
MGSRSVAPRGNAVPQGSGAPRGARIEYFELLRVVATVAVIAIHAAITEWHAIPVDTARSIELTWINSALRWCVPIFFMISGALFLDPGRTVRARSLRRRVVRLLIGYLVWSAGYAALTVYGPGGSRDPLEFVTELVTGHFHLWFLLALIGLNLGTPILRMVAADRRVAWYFVALAAVFAGALPLLTDVPVAGELLEQVLGTMRFDLVLGYSGYFVLGYLLHTARVSRAVCWWSALAGVAGAVGTALGTLAASSAAGQTDERYFDFVTLNVAAMSVAVFLGAKAWGDAHRFSPRWGRFVTSVAGASFGIYLVHPSFLWVLRQCGITTEFAEPWASVAILTAVTLVLSYAASLLIRLIPRARGVLA